MAINLGLIMDPIGSINIKKDSSFAMALAAQARGWQLHYLEVKDLYLRDGQARARSRDLSSPALTWKRLPASLRN